LPAAGYHVQALATLEIAQGRLGRWIAELGALPGVVEAYATGTGDVVAGWAADPTRVFSSSCWNSTGRGDPSLDERGDLSVVVTAPSDASAPRPKRTSPRRAPSFNG